VRFNPAKGRYNLLENILRTLFLDQDSAQNEAGVLLHFIGYPEERILNLEDESEFCYQYRKIACRSVHPSKGVVDAF
jgi:hypothetical protein